jgi:hypothetical protein
MPSKLDLVLITVSIAAAIGLIERSHSIVIDPPDLVALATQATACSDEASVRYGISRMVTPEHHSAAFSTAWASSAPRWSCFSVMRAALPRRPRR